MIARACRRPAERSRQSKTRRPKESLKEVYEAKRKRAGEKGGPEGHTWKVRATGDRKKQDRLGLDNNDLIEGTVRLIHCYNEHLTENTTVCTAGARRE